MKLAKKKKISEKFIDNWHYVQNKEMSQTWNVTIFCLKKPQPWVISSWFWCPLTLTTQATFHTPFTHLGQSAEGCSSYTFPRLMGNAKASELLLFNKKISAAEAYNRNMITAVIPDDMFTKETQAKVETYAKLPPEVLTSSILCGSLSHMNFTLSE